MTKPQITQCLDALLDEIEIVRTRRPNLNLQWQLTLPMEWTPERNTTDNDSPENLPGILQTWLADHCPLPPGSPGDLQIRSELDAYQRMGHTQARHTLRRLHDLSERILGILWDASEWQPREKKQFELWVEDLTQHFKYAVEKKGPDPGISLVVDADKDIQLTMKILGHQQLE